MKGLVMSKEKTSIEKDYFKRFAKWSLIILSLSITLLFSIALSAMIGPMAISIEKAIGIILHQVPFLGSLIPVKWSSTEETVLVQIRLPRVLSAMIVGFALSVAGTVFQCIFRNPMADPYVVGVASGAGFGASLAIVLGVGLPFISVVYSIPLMASIGAILTMFLVYAIARTGSELPVLRLLLTGVAVGSFFSALMSVMMVLAGEDLFIVYMWLLGGFSLSGWEHVKVVAIVVIVGFIVLYAFVRDFNIMLLGEEQAIQLGVEVEKVKKIVFIVASTITAVAVSIGGIIGFIGLIIPHITRILVGPDHRILLLSSALTGAIVLVLCDTLARSIIRPAVLPTGVITTLLGIPFFIYLLKSTGKIKI
jgi:iron complex transport system permease protein